MKLPTKATRYWEAMYTLVSKIKKLVPGNLVHISTAEWKNNAKKSELKNARTRKVTLFLMQQYVEYANFVTVMTDLLPCKSPSNWFKNSFWWHVSILTAFGHTNAKKEMSLLPLYAWSNVYMLMVECVRQFNWHKLSRKMLGSFVESYREVADVAVWY